jgi:hypothetical protein
MSQLQRITVAWEDIDEIDNVTHYFEVKGYLLTEDLAITIEDDIAASLERVAPSSTFPGRYESIESYAEFSVKDYTFLQNIESMQPLELLDKVCMATLL